MVQKLIGSGHKRHEILNVYSMPEVRIFYEKIVRQEMQRQADYIEAVMAGIGGSFGGGDEVTNMVRELRGGAAVGKQRDQGNHKG